MSRRLLDHAEIDRDLADLPGWVRLKGSLMAVVDAPDFRTAIRFVDTVADVAESMDHHPDLDVRYHRVRCMLSTHSAGGITQLDVWVPTIEAPARVDTVLAAGARLADVTHAPAWWVLADAEGNELCVCTDEAEPQA